jgi:hypothetical protein
MSPNESYCVKWPAPYCPDHPVICCCCSLCPKSRGPRERSVRRRKFASHFSQSMPFSGGVLATRLLLPLRVRRARRRWLPRRAVVGKVLVRVRTWRSFDLIRSLQLVAGSSIRIRSPIGSRPALAREMFLIFRSRVGSRPSFFRGSPSFARPLLTVAHSWSPWVAANQSWIVWIIARKSTPTAL